MKKIDGRTKEGKAAKLKTAQEEMFGAGFESSLDKPDKPKLTTTILQEAHDLIYGAREGDYGHPKKNLTDIGQFWQVYLESKYGRVAPIDAEDVCQMMVLLKMARGFNGPKKRDTIVDQAGYTGLLERVQE